MAGAPTQPLAAVCDFEDRGCERGTDLLSGKLLTGKAAVARPASWPLALSTSRNGTLAPQLINIDTLARCQVRRARVWLVKQQLNKDLILRDSTYLRACLASGAFPPRRQTPHFDTQPAVPLPNGNSKQRPLQRPSPVGCTVFQHLPSGSIARRKGGCSESKTR